MEPRGDARERAVLIFALFGDDAAVTQRLLATEGIESECCRSIEELVAGLSVGAGAVIVSEEALVGDSVIQLGLALRAQEAWSDLPIIVSAAELVERRAGSTRLRALGDSGNVSILERPIRLRAMLSAVQSALRARQRQYVTRELLRTLADREAHLSHLVAREQDARNAAETASRGKDEFLATVSHELRTPLNAMLGWARMLRSGQLDGEKRERALAAIERNALAQAQLVEDLLDVSRTVAGKLRIEAATVDVVKLVEAALETARPAVEAKELDLRHTTAPHIGTIVGDPGRLQQVMWNLLSNAVKFTPKGGQVRVDVADSGAQVEVSVSDTGQGIEPDFLPFVFQRFRQADGGSTRRRGGLGLGLAICHDLIELHGGTIEALSDGPGRGATFRIVLPRKGVPRTLKEPVVLPTLEAAPTFDVPEELKGLRVLVVEDDPDAREILVSVIQSWGAQATAAGSAREAFALFTEEKPDVIGSDIGLPDEDGYSFLRRVRELPSERGGQTPAAALTAYTRAQDRRLALQSGFEMHVAKPMDPAELVAVLATLARIGRATR